jgi:hypothetical protein
VRGLASCEEITPDELFDQFRAALPYFAVPRYVEVLERLPVNVMNRVVKHQLKDRPNHATGLGLRSPRTHHLGSSTPLNIKPIDL